MRKIRVGHQPFSPEYMSLGYRAYNQYTLGEPTFMTRSVEGMYRNGKVELLQPLEEAEGSRVIVTPVRPADQVDLRDRGIDDAEAADLRHRLATFAEDWDRPEMAAYDELPPR